MLTTVKTATCLALAMAASTAFASPQWSLRVRHDQNLLDAGLVRLTLQSTERYSSMCIRTPRSMNVQAPFPGASTPDEPQTLGLLSVETAVSPFTPCLMAFGPHRATLDFRRGDELPALPTGYYRLKIDGESQGLLHVFDSGADLVGDQGLFQEP